MHTLYYSPGACSLAVHILLRELDLPHRLVRKATGDEEHRSPEYLEVNPVGKLPTLVREDGSKLTEVAAILPYLAQLKPSAGLVPEDPWQRAQLDRNVAFIASELHPAYALALRPDRTLAEASSTTLEEGRAAGRARFIDRLGHLESRFVGPFALGESFSILDPYVFVMMVWARFIEIDPAPMPKLGAAVARIGSRPAVREALLAEGLTDETGKPTPPSKV